MSMRTKIQRQEASGGMGSKKKKERARQPEIENRANTYRQTLPSQCCKAQRRRGQQRKRGRETSERTYMQCIQRLSEKKQMKEMF